MVNRVLLSVLLLSLLVGGLYPAPSAQAATYSSLTVACDFVDVVGRVETDAPYVMVKVFAASDLSTELASKVSQVFYNGFYARLDFPMQPNNTRLIVSIGEWDGQNYVVPANMRAENCIGGPAAPPPTDPPPVHPTPTPVYSNQPPANTPTATIDESFVACNYATLTGKIGVTAPYVRVAVVSAANLGTELAASVFPTLAGNYSAGVVYAAQPTNSRLLISVGEWDGTNYLSPAQTLGANCVDAAAQRPGSPVLSISNLTATCQSVDFGGSVGFPAPFVRVTVTSAATMTELSSAIVPVYYGSFHANLSFPQQPANSRLIIAAGEWDGQQYLAPAATMGSDCGSGAGYGHN